jgi:triosephosphate isomerase
MRRLIIAGNWKLNNSISEALDLVNCLKEKVYSVSEVDIVVCPVFTAVNPVAEALKGSNIRVGGQDIFWEDKGAFTGEVSGPFLKDAGADYVIIGHSERRQYFCETDEWVNKKLNAALRVGLKPIVCVGESLEERESDKTFAVIERQLKGGFEGISPKDMKDCVIAYEPVWAIGTGKTASPEQAQEVHSFIREQIAVMFGKEISQELRIQYGGSVKPSNAEELLSQEDIDGALVGGASLRADDFARIIKAGL